MIFYFMNAWMVMNVAAYITHWKADVMRKARRLPVPEEEKGCTGRMGSGRRVPALAKKINLRPGWV